MNYEEIKLELGANQVARLTLNRPERHNAMSVLMMSEITAAFEEIEKNESIRAIVINGSGKSFCAGADLKWMQSNLNATREQRIAESKRLSVLLSSVDQSSKLVIAALNGSSFAGGIGLMCACDIVISVDSARFALTETRLGLVPANITPYVLRKIGPANTRRVALNACMFEADMAEKLGFVDKVVVADELDQAVELELKQTLNCAPEAIARTKQMLAQLDEANLDDSQSYLIEQLADAWDGDEAQQGIRAFFAKQPPPWKVE